MRKDMCLTFRLNDVADNEDEFNYEPSTVNKILYARSVNQNL